MKRLRLTPFRISIFLGVLLSVLRFTQFRYLSLMDMRVTDYRFLQRGVMAASPDVVIVAVDDASLEKHGRWPWSRAMMAQLIDRIVAADAKAIGFDIVQSEQTASINVDALRTQVPGVDDKTWSAVLEALAGESPEDMMLIDAVRRSNRSVLGYFFDFTGRIANDKTSQVATYNIVQGGERGKAKIPRAKVARTNMLKLQDASRSVGYFNVIPDVDGSYRGIPMAIRFGSQIARPLSLAILDVVEPGRTLSIRFADFGVESIKFGNLEIPVAEDGKLLVNFRGPGHTFKHISAADVLAGTVPSDALRGKIVLVGVSAAAVGDIRVTPFDPIFPGVEVQATLLDNILRQDFVSQPKWTVLVEIALILLCVFVLGWALGYARGIAGAAVAAFMLGLYLWGSQQIFVGAGLPLSVVYPVLAIVLTYSSISVHHYLTEEREKRKVRDAFGLYLNPHLASMVSKKPELLALGGEKRELTVLFSDIRGFTTISEALTPEALVDLLNIYLGAMTDLVFESDGTLDKYIGDAIMAFWGAPLPQTDHAVRACGTALKMITDLRSLNERLKQQGLPTLDIGIGINTGPMVVGNMGSARRLNYTLMGDNVNLGSRLEGLNKKYGSHIIASELTMAAVGNLFVARELDLVRVKGKLLPVRIYEIVGTRETGAPWKALIEQFDMGLVAYRSQRWDEATAIFQAILQEHPDDHPSELYIERTRIMRATPPGPGWDGVTIMESK